MLFLHVQLCSSLIAGLSFQLSELEARHRGYVSDLERRVESLQGEVTQHQLTSKESTVQHKREMEKVMQERVKLEVHPLIQYTYAVRCLPGIFSFILLQVLLQRKEKEHRQIAARVEEL